MGNGWKSMAALSLAIVGMFAFASDADAFWGRRHRCGHHHQACGHHHGCGHQVGHAHGGCCGGVAVAQPAPCCEAAPAPCCDAAPVAVGCGHAPACCGGAVHHQVGFGGHGGFGHHRRGGCCGGGHVGHVSHGGCDTCGGGGGGYIQHAAPASGGCTNCQAPW